MLRYFTNILLLLLSFPVMAQELDDMEEEEPSTPKINVDSFSQVRISFDISRPVWNYFLESRASQELSIDYYHKKDLYFVAEAGWGNSIIDYSDLKYNSKNSFYRLGINKCMIKRQSSHDWDMGFIGVRYAFAPIERSAAQYTIEDSFWGNVSGTIPAKNMILHWAEVTGGINVELVNGLFAGWTVRGKFRINKGAFQELPPAFIAGYGKGDKGSVFDFNFHLSYAIRWRRIMNPKTSVQPSNINKQAPVDSTKTVPGEVPFKAPASNGGKRKAEVPAGDSEATKTEE